MPEDTRIARCRCVDMRSLDHCPQDVPIDAPFCDACIEDGHPESPFFAGIPLPIAGR